MDQQQLRDAAQDQLNRTLGFFPRVDAKLSVVLAVDTGMLAFLVARIPATTSLRWWDFALPLSTVAILAGSIWFLYKGAFPSLRGGQKSLVYFREIAGRTESHFINEFVALSEPEYTRDLLGQVWRNSEILKEKFDALKIVFVFLALAIPPWLGSLFLFAFKAGAKAGTN